MKSLACNDIMPGCKATFSGETDDEILQQAGQHAVEAHGLTVTPEIRDYLAHPPRSRSTLTAPRSTSDRAAVAAQVDAVLPLVAAAAGIFGYRVPDSA